MRVVKCTVQVWGKAREWEGEIVFRAPEWREEWHGRWEAVHRELLGQLALVGNPFDGQWGMQSQVLDTDTECSSVEASRLTGLCRAGAFSVAWRRTDDQAAQDLDAVIAVEDLR